MNIKVTHKMNPGVPGISWITQRWLESAIGSSQFHNQGGMETLDEWVDKGPLYTYSTLRDPADRSTNVIVNSQFSVAPQNASVFLFYSCRKVATIEIDNGAVVRVEINDQ